MVTKLKFRPQTNPKKLCVTEHGNNMLVYIDAHYDMEGRGGVASRTLIPQQNDEVKVIDHIEKMDNGEMEIAEETRYI